jgi:hypothetical protein
MGVIEQAVLFFLSGQPCKLAVAWIGAGNELFLLVKNRSVFRNWHNQDI